MNILIVENDIKIARFIVKGLEEEYNNAKHITNAEDAFYLIQQNNYDVMIIDWMLPEQDGVSLIKQIRSQNNNVPIIMLTAKRDLNDKLEGIDAGADDYLTKPFSFMELLARIKALHRRGLRSSSKTLRVGDLVVDERNRQVACRGNNIDLTIKEYKLLELLVRNKGKIVINSVIVEEVWGVQDIINSNIISVTMYNLRKKIDIYSKETVIKTIRLSGYRIDDC